MPQISGKGLQPRGEQGCIKGELSCAFATDKIFQLHSVFSRWIALSFPLIVSPLLPLKRNLPSHII